MRDPSPTSHVYRLALVLIAAGVVFVGLVAMLSPASWHYDMGYWHRADSLGEMAAQPPVYGGIEKLSGSARNAACKTCHKAAAKEVRKKRHKALSCESCHDALGDHVRVGKKVAEAKIDRSTGQCQNCHAGLINKPAAFPQFRTSEKFRKHQRFKAGEFKPGTTCLKCHDAHDPTP